MRRIHPPGRSSRRQWLRLAAAGLIVGSRPCWLKTLAAEAAAATPRAKRACILLWMSGGPSQIDTFDMKPDHANGGEFKPIATNVPGIHISEHLPRLSSLVDRLSLIRSMSTSEGDHGRASYFVRTGYMPQGQLQYPTLGSIVSKELADERSELPGFVSISPYRLYDKAAYGPGFLGYRYAPLIVGEEGSGPAIPKLDDGSSLKVKDLEHPDGLELRRRDFRLDLMDQLDDDFIADHPDATTARSHRDAFVHAVRLIDSRGVQAFDLDREPDRIRDAYGRNPFGQGCLLARRLIEQGVPFAEVTLHRVDGVNATGWDAHRQNFDTVRRLSAVLDVGWSTLIEDLAQRGMLETTTIVWMGEFGRTPKINADAGRDHAPNAWTTVLAGGGIRGGTVVGLTSPDGVEIEERPVSIPDLISTVYRAIGVNPGTQNPSNVGRMIGVVAPGARPIEEILT